MHAVKSWFRETTGGLPATFWYLWTGSLINRLGSFILIYLAIYLTGERGFTEVQAGVVLGLWSAGGAVGTLTGGLLADRWGRRGTLLVTQFTAAALMIAFGFAERLPVIAVGALLLGMTNEASRPAYAAMMIDVVPERDRLRAFSLHYWAINLGFASAAVLAGFAAELDYLLLFLINAGAVVISAALVSLRVPENRQSVVPNAVAAGGSPVGGLRTLLADRVFLVFTMLNLLLALVFVQHISMLPIAMGDDGLSPGTYGWVISLNGLLIVTGQLFIPRLVRDRDRTRVLALAAIITGVGFGLTAFAGTALWYALTVLIWTVGEMLQSPASATVLAELSPATMRGQYQGVLSLSWSIAGFAAPILGGFVREQFGNAPLWLGCAGIALLVAVGHLVTGPARERRAAYLRAIARPTPQSEPGVRLPVS